MIFNVIINLIINYIKIIFLIVEYLNLLEWYEVTVYKLIVICVKLFKLSVSLIY